MITLKISVVEYPDGGWAAVILEGHVAAGLGDTPSEALRDLAGCIDALATAQADR